MSQAERPLKKFICACTAALIILLYPACLHALPEDKDNDVKINEIDELYKDGNYPSAIYEYEKYLGFYPQSERIIEIWNKIGDMHFMLGTYDRAIEYYQKVNDAAPSEDAGINALNKIGDSFYRKTSYQTALKKFTQVAEKYPKTTQAKYASVMIDDCRRRLGAEQVPSTAAAKAPRDKKAKDKDKDEVVSKEDMEKDILFRAREEFNKNNYQKANEIYFSFIGKYPQSKMVPYAYLKVAEGYYYLNKYDTSIKYYGVITAKYPDYENADYASYSIGWCLYKQNDLKRALADFENFTIKFPKSQYFEDAKKTAAELRDKIRKDDISALWAKADKSDTVGGYLSAIHYLEKLNGDFPDNPYKVQAASRIDELKAKLKIEQSEEARVLYQKGEKLLKDGNTPDATAVFREVVYKYPYTDYSQLSERSIEYITMTKMEQDAGIILKDAEAKMNESDYSAALALVKEIIYNYPGTSSSYVASQRLPEVYLRLEEKGAEKLLASGLEFQKAGSYKLSIEKLEELIYRYPGSSLIPAAKELIKKSRGLLADREAENQYNIAKRYSELKDYQTAIKEYYRVITDYPTSSYVETARNAIDEVATRINELNAEKLYSAARTLLEKGDYPSAEKNFREVIENYAKTSYAEQARVMLSQIKTEADAGISENLYKSGEASYQLREYEKALDTFNKLILNYPFSRYAPDAQYYKGEVFYVWKGDIYRAILEWRKVADNYAGSDKAPEALFKIANSYEQLGLAQDAKSVYYSIVDRYPESRFVKGELSKLVEERLNAIDKK